MEKKIIFDVGANNGSSCLHFAREGHTVYAFEPCKELLHNSLLPNASDNYIVVPKAISDFDGESVFKVSGTSDWGDWGCSSLNTFSDNLEHTWPGRTDFIVTEAVIVEVIRLDTFIEQNNIKRIDFLHCDTQGTDFKVLKSLGKYTSIVSSGVVEAFNKNPLYKESDNSKENICQFLDSNGFKVIEISSNDSDDNEINIKFERII